MKKTLQTAVMGVTGYAGMELARLLLHHPQLKNMPPLFLGRAEVAGRTTPLTELHPHLMDNNGSRSLTVEPFSWELLKDRGVDVLFLATPHEQSREMAPEAIERGFRVIDLSGAWRLNEAQNRAVYKFEDDGSAAAVSV
jgi:N-acetyl-gamma-glutamyl-phosphate reductase